MSEDKSTQMNGGLSIGRGLSVGGSIISQGSATVHHNLRIEGWLDARNIKGVNKGVFADKDSLLSAYPNGSVAEGSWAIVGGTLPGTLWYVAGGVWTDSGKSAGEVTADVEQYLKDVEKLSDDLSTAKIDIGNETEERKAGDAALESAYKAGDLALQASIEAEVAARKEADTTIETGYKSADTALQSSIEVEATARKEADAALEEAYKAGDLALQDSITAEATARKEGDSAIEASYKDADAALESAYKAADAELKKAYGEADTAEATAREAADTALQASIDSLGKTGYRYMGVATPETDPGQPTENVFYVAVKAGEYTHFGTGMHYIDNDGVDQEQKLSLEEGEVGLLLYAGHTSKGELPSRLSGWKKQPLDLSRAAVAAVKSGLSGVSGGYAPLGADQKLGEVWLPESVTGEATARKEADAALESAYKAADTSLQASIEALAKTGYRLLGVATPETDPGQPTENVFYVARAAGDYTHFKRNGIAVGTPGYITVVEGEIAFLLYPGHTGNSASYWGGWRKMSISCPTGEITGDDVVAALGYKPMDEARAISVITNAAQATTNATQAAANANAAIANANAAAQSVAKATEEASRVNAEIKNGVLSVTNREGDTSRVNIGEAYMELEVKATTDVAGVKLAGTTVSLYLNKSTTALTQDLDNGGTTVFTIARGTYYEIVFPDKNGCKTIAPISGTATGGQSTRTVVYEAYDSADVEHVTVNVRKRSDGSWDGWQGKTVHVKVGGSEAVDYTSDASGQVVFSVQIGQQYTVSMDEDTTGGYYIHLGVYSKSYTAKTTNRVVWLDWYEYRTGVFLVGSDGVERTSDEWDSAGMAETDGVMIKVVTQLLTEGGGTVLFSIDEIYNHLKKTALIPQKQWATGVMQQTGIDGIPNNRSDKNYYNGVASTDTIIAACEAADCEAPAASYCKSRVVEIGGKTLRGYLPACGQWEQVKTNYDAIGTLMKKIKGDDSPTLSDFTEQKWTSTQNSSSNAMFFTSSPGINSKLLNYRAVPFYA